MPVLDLCSYAGFSLIAASRGYFLIAECRLLIVVASLVVEHRLYRAGLRSCGSQLVELKHDSCSALA